MQDGDSELLDAEQVAKLLRIGRSTVYQMISAGELRGVKIGRLRRFSRREVRELVERLEREAEPVAQ